MRFDVKFDTCGQVMSFFDRKIYTWCFLVLGILGSTYVALFIQASPALAIYIWLACWFLSVFTLMPAEIPENNNLVYASFVDRIHAFSPLHFILCQ
jgi:phosphatidylinositol glycan class N